MTLKTGSALQWLKSSELQRTEQNGDRGCRWLWPWTLRNEDELDQTRPYSKNNGRAFHSPGCFPDVNNKLNKNSERSGRVVSVVVVVYSSDQWERVVHLESYVLYPAWRRRTCSHGSTRALPAQVRERVLEQHGNGRRLYQRRHSMTDYSRSFVFHVSLPSEARRRQLPAFNLSVLVTAQFTSRLLMYPYSVTVSVWPIARRTQVQQPLPHPIARCCHLANLTSWSHGHGPSILSFMTSAVAVFS